MPVSSFIYWLPDWIFFPLLDAKINLFLFYSYFNMVIHYVQIYLRSENKK